MKLYEFTVTDVHNLPKSKILEIAEMSAADEAPVREWGDFKVVECLPLNNVPVVKHVTPSKSEGSTLTQPFLATICKRVRPFAPIVDLRPHLSYSPSLIGATLERHL